MYKVFIRFRSIVELSLEVFRLVIVEVYRVFLVFLGVWYMGLLRLKG